MSRSAKPPSRRDSPAEAFLSLRKNAVVTDLSPVIHSDMPGWSSHPCARLIADARSHERHGYYAQSLLISEHTGAHVDAPHHFHASLPSATIDAFPPDALIGPYKKYDLSWQDLQPGELVSKQVLVETEKRDGFELERDDVALIDFGWSRYFLPDEPDWAKRQWWADNTPGLSEDACGYLADAQPRAVGSDTVACDVAVVGGALMSDFGHRTYFLPQGILIIEGLQNLGAIPPIGLFLALPLRLKRGSGSPLRPIAIHARAEVHPS